MRPNPLFFTLLNLITFFVLGGCSQYLLRSSDDPQHYSDDGSTVIFRQNFSLFEKQIESFLKNSGLLPEKVISKKTTAIWTTTWQRGPSLRYYYIDFDHRFPHPSLWKSQWTLSSLGSNSVQLTISVYEALHIGAFSTNDIGVEQPLKNDPDWFEANADSLRATELMRKFLTTHNPQKLAELPASLPITIIKLSKAPLGKTKLQQRCPEKNRLPTVNPSCSTWYSGRIRVF